MTQANIQPALENIEAFNAGDWERLKKCLSTNVVYEDIPSKRRIEGAGQFIEEYQGWKSAAPDCKGKVLRTFVSGDTVIIEVNWKGTNTGPLGGQPPTGRAWDINGCQVISIENNRVKELHQYYDMLSLMQQLGRIPK